MDRNEILEKAQAESFDEGLENVQNNGRKWGVAAFVVVYIVITIFNMIKDKPNDIATIFLMAYLAAESIPEYIFTKKKIYIFTAIAAAIAAVITMINYMIR